MAWRDNLKPASFRGVRFYVEDNDFASGRRISNHEYPFRDKNFPEDLGRKTRTISVTGYVLGDDYIRQRDALQDACETIGPASLVLPLRAPMQVVCESINLNEKRSEGGICTFNLTFIEAGEQQFPSGSADELSSIFSASGLLKNAAASTFLSKISVDNVSDFVREAFGESVSGLGGLLSTIQNNSISGILNDQDLINTSANLIQLITGFQIPGIAYLSDVLGIANDIQSAFDFIGQLSFGPKEAVFNYQQIRNLQVPTSNPITQFGILEQQNRDATKAYSDMVSIANEAIYTPQIEFESYDDAIIARRNFLQTIDIYIPNASDDEYNALSTLRAEISKAVPDESLRLKKIVHITLPRREASLPLAYDRYEDISRAEEIVSRNKVRNPGFIPGGVPVEVLNV